MMMMMAELVDHKKRSHDSFGLGNFTGEKRLRIGGDGEAATMSTSAKVSKVFSVYMKRLMSAYAK